MLEPCFSLSRNFLKSKNRTYRRFLIEKKPFSQQLSILTGQRGVGKTTVIIQHMLDQYDDINSQQMMYIPIDHFSMTGLKIYEIAEHFSNMGGKLLCIDEIHTYPSWSQELKSISDSFPGLSVIASGSSLLKIQHGSHDLSRRSLHLNLPGMSFREFIEMETGTKLESFPLNELTSHHVGLAHDIITNLGELKILALFQQYLRHGYYPYYKEMNDQEVDFFLTLEQGAHTSIRSDMTSLYPALTGSSIHKIERLLAIIAKSTPFKPDLRKLSQTLGVGDERTLKDYLIKLQDACIISTLSRAGSPLSSLAKPEKIYLNNTNQIFAYGGDQGNLGNIRETFFLSSVSPLETITYPKNGDFQVDKTIFEVGGKNKSFDQIKDLEDSFLAIDDIEVGYGHKIPLWMFGFLY